MVARNGAGGGLQWLLPEGEGGGEATDTRRKTKEIASRFNSHVSELACNDSRANGRKSLLFCILETPSVLDAHTAGVPSCQSCTASGSISANSAQ